MKSETPEAFHLEPATWRDYKEFKRLERASFGDLAWPPIELLAALLLPTVTRIKAVVEGRMAGLVAGTVRADRCGWIMTIATFREYQGIGIGGAMLSACEAQLKCEKLKLCVQAGNDTAIRLYLRHGYRHTEIWKDYYGKNLDALVMEKEKTGARTDSRQTVKELSLGG